MIFLYLFIFISLGLWMRYSSCKRSSVGGKDQHLRFEEHVHSRLVISFLWWGGSFLLVVALFVIALLALTAGRLLAVGICFLLLYGLWLQAKRRFGFRC